MISSKEKKAVLKKFGRHISQAQVKLMQAAHLDFLETERNGASIRDAGSGRRIFDSFSSAGCFNVGRGNAEVIDAVCRAADEIDMGTPGLASRMKVECARRLAAVSPGNLNHVMFTAAGGDAIDCALKFARGATGRNEIIAMSKAYHGHSGFSLSANGKDYYRNLFEPLMPGFSFIPFGDLDAARRVASEKTAAIILEPIQGEGGIHVGDDFYLRGLRDLCDSLGIMLIFDEIQTGFARTGRMFYSEYSGVVPDMMVVAKSISGGLFPNSAVVYRDMALLRDFVNANPEFHTSWGGSDLGCAAGIAVIDFLEKNRIWENAAEMGKLLMKALRDIMKENPHIVREVRGKGLMIGIEYTHEYMGTLMSDSLSKHGIFAVFSGNQPQVMRFMFPVTITEDEMRRVIVCINRAIKTMKSFFWLTVPLSKIPWIKTLLNDQHLQVASFIWIRYFEDLFGITKRSYGREE